MATAYGSIASNSKESSAGGGADTLVITKPTGLAVGDLMIALVGVADRDGTVISISGWTTIFTENDFSTGIRGFVKVANSGDVAATDFTFSISGVDTTDSIIGLIVRVTGTNGFLGLDNLVVAKVLGTGTTTKTFTPGLTPSLVGSLLLMGAFLTSGTATQSGYAITNNNPTWTERLDINQTAASGPNSLSLASATATHASATGDYTITLSANVGAFGYLIAVNEIQSRSGNHSVLTTTSDIFTHSISVGTTANHVLLAMASSITDSQAKIENPVEWEQQEQNTNSWTQQKQ